MGSPIVIPPLYWHKYNSVLASPEIGVSAVRGTPSDAVGKFDGAQTWANLHEGIQGVVTTDKWTVSRWALYTHDLSASDSLCYSRSYDSSRWNLSFYHYVGVNGTYIIFLNGGGTGVNRLFTTEAHYTKDIWMHEIITYDASDPDKIHLYINGVEMVGNTPINYGMPAGPVTWEFGPDVAYFEFAGNREDNTMVFGYIFNQSQRDWLYNHESWEDATPARRRILRPVQN